MANQYFNRRHLDFLLYEVHRATELLEFPFFADHSKETFDLIIDTANQFADSHLKPLLTVMDREQPEIKEGKIRVHPKLKSIMAAYGEGGWISAQMDYKDGGQQIPGIISTAAAFIFGAANYSASVFPYLSTGAANLILTFGGDNLKKQFVPNMLNGLWQGTMALTEPDAGSSLGDIVTKAIPNKSGHYNIQGQKIYISAGDHDAVDNVIHLLLARIEGAPAGTKGISLFVVPQKRVDKEGALADNDVVTAGLYHKMGYKGIPIAHLMFGEHSNCQGYLVGEPNQGLKYMFQMMNEARVEVGLGAVAIATAAYYASLEYARERPQGRLISDKEMSKPQVPIIKHADVKRMLLFQKSIIEGSHSLLVYCSKLGDLAKVTSGEKKEGYELLLDLLTPIAKSYPSEMGCLTTSMAIQIHGGAGYCDDFPVEQYYREIRIHPIHEGTTTIHGIDLLGRKVMIKQGAAFKLLIKEIQSEIELAMANHTLKQYGEKLASALQQLNQVTLHLMHLAQREKAEVFLSDASIYLEFVSIIAVSWQWLAQSNVASKKIKDDSGQNELAFYQSKIQTMNYYFEYELPKYKFLSERLLSEKHVTLATSEDLLI